MLEQIISRYIESNKRLIIPDLGAFIVKVPGQSIVFSELLKRNDGILEALVEQTGVSKGQATAMIEEFVGTVRTTINGGKSFKIEGLGHLKAGANATISFEYQPSIRATNQHTPIEDGATKLVGNSANQTITETTPILITASTPEVTLGQLTQTANPDANIESVEPKLLETQKDTTNPASEPQSNPKPEEGSASTLLRDFGDTRKRIADMLRNAPNGSQAPQSPNSGEEILIQTSEIKISPSAKLNPAPHVKGLRYAKPHRNNDTYAYSGGGKRRVDRFLLIALASAFLAVAVIAYVFFRDAREKTEAQIDEQTIQVDSLGDQIKDSK